MHKSTTLNPDAREWRPAAAAVAPPHKVPPPCPFQSYYYPSPPGRHSVTYYPPIVCLYRPIRVPKFIPVAESKIRGTNDQSNGHEEKPLSIDAGNKKGRRRAFPPRFRREVRSFPSPRPVEPRQCFHEAAGGGDDGDSPPPVTMECSDSTNTTIMIRNIPNKLRRDFMLKFIDEHCKSYSLEYDFLYLPMDFRKEGNLGYAFVNFTSTTAALQSKKVLENYKWHRVYTDKGPITSKKVCEVTWARIQGKEALTKRFKNSIFFCDNMEFLPVVLDPPRNGSETDPAPPVVLGKLHRSRH